VTPNAGCQAQTVMRSIKRDAKHHKPNAGFTLLEILVVVVIIAVLAGLATLATGGGEVRTLRSEAKRLQQLLLFAMEEAGYRYQQYGFVTDELGYHFLRFDSQRNRWEAIDEAAFGPHPLPDSLKLRLRIEGELWELPNIGKEGDKEREKSTTQPQLLMLSSGEITPFTLELRLTSSDPKDALVARLSSDGLSAVDLEFIHAP